MIITAVTVAALISLCGISQERPGKNNEPRPPARSVEKRCPANPDSLYQREKVLRQLANMLESSIPEYKRHYEAGFYVIGETAAAFDVYDLVDTSNIDSTRGGRHCINFIDRHIYHVYPAVYQFSFSHIVILEGGQLKVFKSINCKDRGGNLKEVINYVKQTRTNDKEKDEIINRVNNYRKYGFYTKTDNYASIRCQHIAPSKTS
jgi:hypothetical protein